MNLKEQAQSQIAYSKTHVGKTLGIGAGIATGVLYGMSGKKDNWVIAGFALGGAVAGAVLGGLFDNAKNSQQAMSNAAGFADDLYIGGTEGLDKRATSYVKSGGTEYSNVGGKVYKVVCGKDTPQAGNTFTTTGNIILAEHNGDVQGWEEWACGRQIIGDVGAANPNQGGGNINKKLGKTVAAHKTNRPVNRVVPNAGLAGMNTLVQPVSFERKVGSKARQNAGIK